MSDPFEARCHDCGRGPLECEVLLAVRGGLTGWDVHAQLGCNQATVARLRARLTAAEKMLRRCEWLPDARGSLCCPECFGHALHEPSCTLRAVLAWIPAEDAAEPPNAPEIASDSSALEKALGALRAIMRLARCDVGHETAALDQIYEAGWHALYAALPDPSGGAHVEALKAQKEEEK